ncbi:putative glycosyl hydrolase [Dactylonectria macrodidyma]|uniref:beta-glucosidase n=1 Tax=Dactylonectria macrodidyma TaxID=307937 RepID=A0A9P9F8Z4_9HYPO|nr:putative glycosyl hydrolase [Dactylonectria macrodidyma]
MDRVSLVFDAEKVQSQLQQLSLEEKVSLLSGSGFATTVSIPRLGIPSLKVIDVLAGEGPTTVCFPSTSCFGATWNIDLIRRLGEALGSQAKAKDVATIMGPGVNLHRDPRCGRNFEYFSEDPFLTGRLGAALINGIQSQGVGACAKHFVANDAENYRRSYNVLDPSGGRALRELYLAAFQEVLVHSNPAAIMTSYNKVENFHTSETPLLAKVIRGEWGYDGAIQSDWFGTVSTVQSILAGQDLEMPGPSIFRGPRLVKAVRDGLVSEEQIDQRATKMLEWIDKVSQQLTKPPLSQGDSVTVARQVAAEGIVLLKNEGQVLPLDSETPIRLAVIGLPAIDPPVGGGGSSLAPPQYVQSAFDAIRAAHFDQHLVRYGGGVRCNRIIPTIPSDRISTPDGQQGVSVTYYNNSSPSSPVFTERQGRGQVMMLGRLAPGLDESGGFRYEISTTFIPESTGNHTIGVRSTGAYRLFIDESEIISVPSPTCNAETFLFTPHKLETSVAFTMRSGQSYSVRLVVQSWKSTVQRANEPSPHMTELCFLTENTDDQAIAEAVSLARDSDVSIVFAGRNSQHEGEGSDMENISLPNKQEDLIRAVAAASKKTVVILYSGGPLDVSAFVESVDAIINAHYLGQEGGLSLADVLYGKISPSGKLATTWPMQLEDVATFGNFPASMNRDGQPELVLQEGTEFGYRRPQNLVSPRYPFGYGLSYTVFQFSDLAIEPSHIDTVREYSEAIVSVRVTNTGHRTGAEVVQVYVQPSGASGHSPKILKGFSKILLEPGASSEQKVKINIRRALRSWDPELEKWRLNSGTYHVSINGYAAEQATISVGEQVTWLGL